MFWRLWLLVVPDRQTKGRTRSPIELFWTAKNGIIWELLVKRTKPTPSPHHGNAQCSFKNVFHHSCFVRGPLLSLQQNLMEKMILKSHLKCLRLSSPPCQCRWYTFEYTIFHLRWMPSLKGIGARDATASKKGFTVCLYVPQVASLLCCLCSMTPR